MYLTDHTGKKRINFFGVSLKLPIMIMGCCNWSRKRLARNEVGTSNAKCIRPFEGKAGPASISSLLVSVSAASSPSFATTTTISLPFFFAFLISCAYFCNHFFPLPSTMITSQSNKPIVRRYYIFYADTRERERESAIEIYINNLWFSREKKTKKDWWV